MQPISRRSLFGSAILAAGSAPAHGMAKLGIRNHPLDGIKREKIKITDVKVTLLSAPIPPERQWFNPRTIAWKVDAVLVQVFTDQGIVGIGEADPFSGPEPMQKFAEQYVKPALAGQNPFDVELLAGGWTASPSSSARPMAGYQVWAGIDCALWDIIGKAAGLPVYRLLATSNEPNPHIRLYASGGDDYAWYKRPDALIDEALQAKEEGYTAFKFRLGTSWQASGITVQKYVPLIRKLREAVGPKFDLIQESNMRLSFEECLELAPVLEELKFLWFEEPCSARVEGGIENYIKIRSAMPHVMVSGGESLRNRFEVKEWMDRGALDIVQPDCNRTGVTEAWHIAQMARLKERYCSPHDWCSGLTIMANAALAAAIPNRQPLELTHTYTLLKEGVFKDPLVAKRGYMVLPDRPGFGMELAADLAKKFPYLPGSYSRPNPDLPSQDVRPSENW